MGETRTLHYIHGRIKFNSNLQTSCLIKPHSVKRAVAGHAAAC